MTDYMMGVDIGTTSTKAVLFNKKGKIICQHSAGYPLLTPTPFTAEQHPEAIVQAVFLCIQTVMKESKASAEEVAFISFSSAMHSLIAVDETGHPMTNSITWADNRSMKAAEEIKQDHDGHSIYLRTGTPIHPMSPLSKIRWLKSEKPEIFKRTFKFIGIKEFVFFKLFGKFVVDHSIASATGLMNLQELKWDQDALNVAGITEDRLSELVPTTTILKGIKDEYANELGIDKNTEFVIGASDGVLSNLGVNAVDPGVVAVTIGTSGAIRTISDKPVTDKKGRTFCYALTDKHWVIGGAVNNGGMILRWIKDQLGADEVRQAKEKGIEPYELLMEKAQSIPPGSDGLLFHPYLTGERAPLWSADARGSFFGLALVHTREHMIRSVLEGIIFNLFSVMLALQEMIGMPKRIQATGGFARSELWKQIMADIFNQSVHVPDGFESSCLGAVILGMYAQGDSDAFDNVSDMIGTTNKHEPIEENVQIYRELTPIFLSISHKMAEEYERISAFQKKHSK